MTKKKKLVISGIVLLLMLIILLMHRTFFIDVYKDIYTVYKMGCELDEVDKYLASYSPSIEREIETLGNKIQFRSSYVKPQASENYSDFRIQLSSKDKKVYGWIVRVRSYLYDEERLDWKLEAELTPRGNFICDTSSPFLAKKLNDILYSSGELPFYSKREVFNNLGLSVDKVLEWFDYTREHHPKIMLSYTIYAIEKKGKGGYKIIGGVRWRYEMEPGLEELSEVYVPVAVWPALLDDDIEKILNLRGYHSKKYLDEEEQHIKKSVAQISGFCESDEKTQEWMDGCRKALDTIAERRFSELNELRGKERDFLLSY